MPTGYYLISHGADKRELIAEVIPTAEGNAPADQQRLLIDIAGAITVLQQVYGIESVSFQKAFEQVFYLAKVGLEGPNAQPEMASAALKQLKKEVVDQQAGKIKNGYLGLLGKRAACLGVLPVICGTLTHFISRDGRLAHYIDLPGTGNMLILWGGTMLGVWLSFAITKVTLDFEDLAILEKDRLEPFLRLVFTGGLAIVFGLLFMKKALVIEMGGLSSESVATDPIVAFLMGVALGLNERIIGRVLWRKTGEMLER